MKTKRSVFLIYGEQAVTVSFKVPESKRDEIVSEIRDKVLSKYENPQRVDVKVRESLKSSSEHVVGLIEIDNNAPSWATKYKKVDIGNVEKKSNPADDTLEVLVENKVPEWATKHKQVLKVEKSYNVGTIENGEIKFTLTTEESYDGEKAKALLIDEIGQFVKPKPKFTPNAIKNAVNMDALRAIANGEGVKSELFATKKKPIDEEYDCIEVTRGIPDILDRVYVSPKSDVAFWDRNDATVFYVMWESKCYRFVNSGQFNKFLKDNNIK